jgi:hypothetical protein
VWFGSCGQVSQLDLSNVDLGKPSGRKLHRDYKWTLMLLLKLSLPVLLSVVRASVGDCVATWLWN